MDLPPQIVLFDGVCNFCNRTVQFIIRKERVPRLKFAPLQSDTGKALLRKYHITQGSNGTIVYIKNGKAFTKSSAALRLTAGFKGLWPLLSLFLAVPPFIRNGIYNLVARNRYKWWGRTDACQIPSQEMRTRFLDL